MKRDDKGRFSKSSEERLKLTLDFPPIKKIIIYLILGLVLLPWILLITKLNLFRKVLDYFELLFKFDNEEIDSTPKKNGLFH